MTTELQLYTNLLSEIKDRIRTGQQNASLAVNQELIAMYWDIGKMIHDRQEKEGWGTGVIPRLAKGIVNELPTVKGFSERNLKRMLKFYREYSIGQDQAIVPQLVAQLPWGHNILLLERVKSKEIRRWYSEKTIQEGWSRDSLAQMIKNQAYERQGNAITNFHEQLPDKQSELAAQTLKDPYIFDFLTLTEPFKERELETALLKHLEQFLLELGEGFAFVCTSASNKISPQLALFSVKQKTVFWLNILSKEFRNLLGFLIMN